MGKTKLIIFLMIFALVFSISYPTKEISAYGLRPTINPAIAKNIVRDNSLSKYRIFANDTMSTAPSGTLKKDTKTEADAGTDMTVSSGDIVTLKGRAHSADSPDIKVVWSQIRGIKIDLSSNSELNPSFKAPNVDKTKLIVFRLHAISKVDSASDTVTIKIHPKSPKDFTDDRSAMKIPLNGKLKTKPETLRSDNQTQSVPETSEKRGSSGTESQTTRFTISSDQTAPVMVSTSPLNGAKGVSLSSLIKATFSEPILSSSVTSSTFRVKDASKSTYIIGSRYLSTADGGKAVTFAPTSKLAPSTTYIATLTTGIKDLAGNRLSVSKSWIFVTTSVVSSTNFFDNFEGGTYSLPEGGTSPNGKWIDKWNGYGQAGVKTLSGSNIFYEIPKASTHPSETHSSLVTSNQKFSDSTIELDMNTFKQLRQNSAPNTWEAAWVFWRVVDLYHSYYFVLKTNGIEFGKKDNNCNCEEQVFLKTGSSPKLVLGSWSHIKISSVGKHTTIWVNGIKVVDMDDPSYNSAQMSSGYIGLYNEDSSVGFDNVNVGPP